MVNSQDFANRLQKILDFYGISATAFSEKIDFNRSTISHLLSGRNKPSLEFVLKVLKEFPEVELYWLLNGSGSFPANSKLNDESKIPNQNILSESTQGIEDLEQRSKPVDEQKPISEEIDRIVIFYKDGSFKSYLP